MTREPRLPPVTRAWNTWDPVHPAELVHLPTGTHVAICAYSDAAGTFTRFPPGKGVVMGPRDFDATAAALTLEHAGTKLAVDIDKPDDDTVRIAWRTLANGEWGLRFWLCIVLWRDGEGGHHVWTYDPDSTEMAIDTGAGTIVAKGPRFPLMATFHDDLGALAAEYEREGYFYLASRGTEGPLAVLRYNLEEMDEFEVAVALGADREAAAAKADAALALPPPEPAPRLQTGRHAGGLDAIRDVVAWKTVWDRANRRPYTSLSRHWVAQKFGGWGVWLNDVAYHGLMAGLFDSDVAHENQLAVFDGRAEAGNLPCLLTGNDSWVDRSQPPILSFITWMQYLRSGDRSFLTEAHATLAANHDWWWRHRDGNGNGLLEYGTSPVGDGLYRGTKLAAKDESMMDNSPVHDEARLDPDAHTLDCEDVALNSFVALDAEMLALIAAELGDEAEARRHSETTRTLKARIAAELWDPDRRIFANRLWSGRFARSLAPTSFFPMVAGAASREQAADLVARHLLNEGEFWGDHVAPAVSRDDPAFHDNVYWRGRIWPPLNFMTYYGLRRYGYDDIARQFAEKSHVTFMLNWEEKRICGENFNGTTGHADDQPDTDLFYAWGALMTWIAGAETCDINPWDGWTVTNAGAGDECFGPVLGPAGPMTVTVRDGRLTLEADGRRVLVTDMTGRFRHLSVGRDHVRIDIPAGPAGALEVSWLGEGPAIVATAAGHRLEPLEPGTARFAFEARDAPVRLEVEARRD